MILNHCNFFSKTLNNHVDINVLLPSMTDNEQLLHSLDHIYQKRTIPVLYLLHGALDDYTMWLRCSNIERYAEAAGIAVVMPSGQNGFYSNALFGLNHFDYITQELPRFIEYTFPVSTKSQHRYIAGTSMGGYGAAKCALAIPGQYRAFGNFSGTVDPERMEPLMTKMGYDFFRYDLIFGGSEQVTGSKDDLKVLAQQCMELPDKPHALITCGEQDINNYKMNLNLFELLKRWGFDSEFYGGKGGHDWSYWDDCIQIFVNLIKNLSAGC